MDYKRIIKSRTLRLKILNLLSFIPDKPMIRMQYLIKTGHILHLKKPKRFTEKLQWYKLNYKNELMIQCVDKADVREYIKDKGLGDILVPCYGVYNSFDEIDFESLPDEYVIKDTLGGGGNSVIIVDGEIKESKLKSSIDEWIKINSRKPRSGREWPYSSGKKHRIIIEKLLRDKKGELIDYKFFCFNGKVEFLYVMGNRKLGDSVEVGIYNRHFNRIHANRVGDYPYDNAIKPEGFERMVKIAETLSKEFPHVRVDLYYVDSKIYFGELTFYNASGYMKYQPDSFDIAVGKRFKLPRSR